MKKIVSILLTVCILSVSCRKAIDNPTPITPTDNPKPGMSAVSAPLEKKFVVNGQDILLKLVMEPAVVCYSYRNGETPKPCDIFIEFTFTLSQPLSGYVSVDIQKNNIMESTNPLPLGSGSESELVIKIAPNTTKLVYRTSFQNNNNVMVAENKFSIKDVNYYNFVN